MEISKDIAKKYKMVEGKNPGKAIVKGKEIDFRTCTMKQADFAFANKCHLIVLADQPIKEEVKPSEKTEKKK
jgi:hypothetical protein